MQLELPEPYSFELSMERYRRFGPDPAALWHEGGIHRVLSGREIRIEAAPAGVRITPGEADVMPEVKRFLGAFFDLKAFYEFAVGDAVLSRLATELAGFRPPILGDPFESLVSSITAQQVSLMAALAIRTRLVERYGVKHEHAGSSLRASASPRQSRASSSHSASRTARPRTATGWRAATTTSTSTGSSPFRTTR